MKINLPDDNGFLALVAPDRYQHFVDENWDYDQIMAHFRQQMRQRAMLLWGTGREDMWQVEVRTRPGIVLPPYRKVTGGIIAAQGHLCVASYTDLTMAAVERNRNFLDMVPKDQVITVPPGNYRCHIARRFIPFLPFNIGPDFVLTLLRTDKLPEPWSVMRWPDIED
ncbi:MAG: hypothetical protein ACYDCO_01005 [Armatimonadota bacterium]